MWVATRRHQRALPGPGFHDQVAGGCVSDVYCFMNGAFGCGPGAVRPGGHGSLSGGIGDAQRASFQHVTKVRVMVVLFMAHARRKNAASNPNGFIFILNFAGFLAFPARRHGEGPVAQLPLRSSSSKAGLLKLIP